MDLYLILPYRSRRISDKGSPSTSRTNWRRCPRHIVASTNRSPRASTRTRSRKSRTHKESSPATPRGGTPRTPPATPGLALRRGTQAPARRPPERPRRGEGRRGGGSRGRRGAGMAGRRHAYRTHKHASRHGPLKAARKRPAGGRTEGETTGSI